MNDKLYTQCSCGTEMLLIEREPDSETSPMWYVSIWRRGHVNYDISWKNRLRHIWHILRTGSLWGDSLVLETKQMKELQDYINKQLPEKSSNTKTQ
jgi:hypothetical protein